jgi:hypothetical protein
VAVASRWRELGSLGICLILGSLALGPLPRIPGLALVDLGFASLGHAAGGVVDAVLGTPVVPAVAGLVAPVVVPLALAVRFVRSGHERAASALCLAWAATVLTALAAAAGEAAEPGPAGDGAPQDWAVLLGPRALRVLGHTAGIMDALRGGAMVLLVVGVVLSAAPLVLDAARSAGGNEAPAAAWNGPNRRRV